jgi:hypothetical protein
MITRVELISSHQYTGRLTWGHEGLVGLYAVVPVALRDIALREAPKCWTGMGQLQRSSQILLFDKTDGDEQSSQ